MTLPSLERTYARLGDRAVPAGGRRPLPRFTFAACTTDALEATKTNRARALVERTGPLRCTPVDVMVARTPELVDELLDNLRNLGQGPDTLAHVWQAWDAVNTHAGRLGLEAALVVAACGVLTPQATASVPYS